jgi:general secretion pathway protein D
MAAAVLLPAARAAEKEKKWGGSGQATVQLSLQGSSIEDLIKIVQRHTNKVFLYQERVRKTRVYAKGTQEIPVEALYPIFQSILAIHGYTTVPTPNGHGGVTIKIITAREAMWRPSRTFSKEQIDEIPTHDQMVSLIYPLKYAKAQVTMNSLRQLINPSMGGYMQGIPNVEVILISDFAPNVRRIAKVIELMDVPGPQLAVDIVRLQNATSQETIQILSQLTSRTGQTARPAPRRGGPQQGSLSSEVHFTADERTNSIIVQALPEELGKIKFIITRLDARVDEPSVGIHIVRLRHTNAEDMEEAVNAILDARPAFRRSSQTTVGRPAVPGRRMPQPPSSTSRPAEENRMAAIADRETNSLIVVAPAEEFKEILHVIKVLDQRRYQVLVQLAIIEVNAGSGMNIGLEFTTLDGTRDRHTRGFAATQWGFSNLVDGDGVPILSSGYPRGRLPTSTSGITMGLHRGKEYRIPALLNLLGNDNDVNVLSMPHIVTMDNKRAEIRILNQEPSTTSSSTTISNQVGFGGFEEAGVTLEITPHISSGDYLRLEIAQKISQFSGSSTVLETGGEVTGILPPGKSTNEITSVITVPNNRTVVIGGLTSRKETKTVSKIPLLGDIPLLGYLFKRESTDVKKSNLERRELRGLREGEPGVYARRAPLWRGGGPHRPPLCLGSCPGERPPHAPSGRVASGAWLP